MIVKAAAALDAMPQVPCTACRYCEKGCPQQIAIPGIFRALNNYMIYGNKEGLKATTNGKPVREELLLSALNAAVVKMSVHNISRLSKNLKKRKKCSNKVFIFLC